jgi:hypothetical protein
MSISDTTLPGLFRLKIAMPPSKRLRRAAPGRPRGFGDERYGPEVDRR